MKVLHNKLTQSLVIRQTTHARVTIIKCIMVVSSINALTLINFVNQQFCKVKLLFCALD